MLEIPEANTIAAQLNEVLSDKSIETVRAAASPHKFAWYFGDPEKYPERFQGQQFLKTSAAGGMVELKFSQAFLIFSDGVNIRFHQPASPLPEKNQLLLKFTDGRVLSASVQMYGGLFGWLENEVFENPYYLAAKLKPSPLDDTSFTEAYFNKIITSEEVRNLSLKAALATQQRIPGLGNGVLQDILWNAKLNHRRKVNSLSSDELHVLFSCLKQTLAEMTRLGGRDTEKNLFGNPGGYSVIMQAKNNGSPCPCCGNPISKEAYLGGSVYFCSICQK